MVQDERISGKIEKQEKKDARKITPSLFFRWMSVIPIFVFYFSGDRRNGAILAFLETLAISLAYNVLISSFLLKRRSRSGRVPIGILYMDALLLAVFVYFSGGLSSDVYLLFYFLIGCCGIYNHSLKTLKFCLFCAVVYSVPCIVDASRTSEVLNLGRLLVRDLLILLAGMGISFITYEVRRYDEMHKKEFRMARTDKLTGLANRHYFDQKLMEEVEYAKKYGTTLNVLLFDLDNFKKFNDTYGHSCGDKLLTLFSDIIKRNIRQTDIPVRYGGEEFLVLIRDLDELIAKSVGERIRKQLEKQSIYVGNGETHKCVTASCGLAQYPTHSTDIKEVIDMADKALYYAKETGKNKVVAYSEIEKTNQGKEML